MPRGDRRMAIQWQGNPLRRQAKTLSDRYVRHGAKVAQPFRCYCKHLAR